MIHVEILYQRRRGDSSSIGGIGVVEHVGPVGEGTFISDREDVVGAESKDVVIG